jgi:hypothetical protein
MMSELEARGFKLTEVGTDKVVYLKEENGILAVFPELPCDFQGNLTCYAHIGQHSGCDPEYAKELQPTMVGIEDLRDELECIGYKPYALAELPTIYRYKIKIRGYITVIIAAPSKRIACEYIEAMGYEVEKAIREYRN